MYIMDVCEDGSVLEREGTHLGFSHGVLATVYWPVIQPDARRYVTSVG